MTLIMGVLNATPDSFYGPSRVDVPDVRKRVLEMVSSGADIIDIGAVSTRPGADAVSPEEEWGRLSAVLPYVMDALEGSGCRLSVDTSRSWIVRRVHDAAGPVIVNDISAGEDDPDMLPLVGSLGLTYVAMHKRGNPRTMVSLADYPEGVCDAVLNYFDEFSVRAVKHGITDWILDPGFGFAKTEEQNLELLESLGRFKRFGRPILVGIADKRFTHGRTAELQRLAVRNGADILRVHKVTRM